MRHPRGQALFLCSQEVNRLICIYTPDCNDFSTNGLAVLSPESCVVTETLNGEWELTLVHPQDEHGKWQLLTEGSILRAPVPASMTPRVNMVEHSSFSGDLREVYAVDTDKPEASVRGGTLRLRTGPGFNYAVLKQYSNGTLIQVIAKTSAAWYEVVMPDGKRGYMDTRFIRYLRTEGSAEAATQAVVEPRQLRDQPFRIYRVVPDLSKITVYARHIFYDLLDNMIRSFTPTAATMGADVVQGLATCCLSDHPFTFHSDLTSTAEEVTFENVNPVEALLGDGGVTEKYGAELARDWYDVYLVSRVGVDSDVEIRQAKNLLGISYDVDLTDVTTRIMPTGEDKDGNLLYLPELYIDSPLIGNYPHVKWIHLPVSGAKEVTEGDSRKSLTECYAEMREAAQTEFDAGCDLPTVTLQVDFINCADTEEYRDYAALSNIYLGDAVRVVAPRIGVYVSMRMTQYTYDCLLRKYTSMTLGTVTDTIEGNIISTRQLASGSITGAKLAINSIGAGQLQSSSVGSLQIKQAAIETAHIQDATITRAKIAEATVTELNAESITAISARIKELAAESIVTDELYVALATIATAQITAANIENANIQWADIGALAAEIAQIAAAQINTANINTANIDWAAIANLNAQIAEVALAQITAASIENAHIDWADIADLQAAIARIAVAQITTAHLHDADIDWASIETLVAQIAEVAHASIKTADIDWAQIKDMVAGTAIIEKGVNGKLYVADLAVTEANMATLTVGELIVKGKDGGFYSVSVDEEGNITTEKKNVGADDVLDDSLPGGKLIENTITARELNVAAIFADTALIRAVKAANIDVDSLFAAQAFITHLNAVDISGNESLRLYVETAKDEALDAVGDAVAQITVTADEIRNEVKRDYASLADMQQLQETVSTLAEQSEDRFTWSVSQLSSLATDLEQNRSSTEEQFKLIQTYMTFDVDGLTIGKAGNPFTFRVINDRVGFYMNGAEVAYLSNNKLYVTQAEILTQMKIGKFAFAPQSNGNMSVIYAG